LYHHFIGFAIVLSFSIEPTLQNLTLFIILFINILIRIKFIKERRKVIMSKILVIGTDPPCPRCSLLTKLVNIKIDSLGIQNDIEHISYTDSEAIIVAKKYGLTPGTAKNVAHILNEEISIDLETNFFSTNNLLEMNLIDSETMHLEKLISEVYNLDICLRKFENNALDSKIMMTPVLVINGEIIHQGSIPKLSEIEAFLKTLI
jgi:hypothetical protein